AARGCGRRLCSARAPRGQDSSRGLWIMRTAWGTYYYARCSINGVVVRTRATRSPAEAERLRRALIALQRVGAAAGEDERLLLDAAVAAADLGLVCRRAGRPPLGRQDHTVAGRGHHGGGAAAAQAAGPCGEARLARGARGVGAVDDGTPRGQAGRRPILRRGGVHRRLCRGRVPGKAPGEPAAARCAPGRTPLPGG
ncbi:unnamed protein product, partial [Prorocentrum cordatum]